jgi:hypothetical protein
LLRRSLTVQPYPQIPQKKWRSATMPRTTFSCRTTPGRWQRRHRRVGISPRRSTPDRFSCSISTLCSGAGETRTRCATHPVPVWRTSPRRASRVRIRRPTSPAAISVGTCWAGEVSRMIHCVTRFSVSERAKWLRRSLLMVCTGFSCKFAYLNGSAVPTLGFA